MARIGGYAFVDDSGDVGTRGSSKNHFIMGGFFIRPDDSDALIQQLAKTREAFGLPPDHVFHFKNYSHERRVRLAEAVAVAPITGFGAVLCKRSGPEKRPWEPEHLYNWMVRLVLERSSWFFGERGIVGSVTFEHLKGHQIDKTNKYVERLKEMETGINWDALHLPLRFAGKHDDERLQAADTIGSAVGQAFQGGDLGVTESRYLLALGGCLWRRGGKLGSYGLKLQPPLGTAPPCPTDHSWVNELPGFG